MGENKNIVINLGSPLTLLGIAFIILRLVGVIEWSWWWVLAPIWMPWALLIGIILICVLIALVIAFIKNRRL